MLSPHQPLPLSGVLPDVLAWLKGQVARAFAAASPEIPPAAPEQSWVIQSKADQPFRFFVVAKNPEAGVQHGYLSTFSGEATLFAEASDAMEFARAASLDMVLTYEIAPAPAVSSDAVSRDGVEDWLAGGEPGSDLDADHAGGVDEVIERPTDTEAAAAYLAEVTGGAYGRDFGLADMDRCFMAGVGFGRRAAAAPPSIDITVDRWRIETWGGGYYVRGSTVPLTAGALFTDCCADSRLFGSHDDAERFIRVSGLGASGIPLEIVPC